MAKAETKKGSSFWNFVDKLDGDKVVWMIVLLLMLFSIVAVFSSTPQLALQTHSDRMSIVGKQLSIVAFGLGVIVLLHWVGRLRILRSLSQFGFIASLCLLLILVSHKSLGFITPKYINSAWRVLEIGGFQFHVFEFVKVAMVMYLAWAVDAYQRGKLSIVNALKAKERFRFLERPFVQRLAYIYVPIFSVAGLIMVGSLSSTIFIGGMMIITVMLGGFPFRHILKLGVAAVCVLLLLIAFNSVFPEDNKPFPHLATALGRLDGKDGEDGSLEETILTAPKNSAEFRKAVDKLQQPMSAEIAIKEGGLIGKGPGRSTQRYVTPVMFEDYMFSFIIEEYGLIGGIVIIILYISLLSRGSLIVRNCKEQFAKTTVASLCLLISLQAMMHMLVNVRLGPMTGQTLPMISHGNSSFLMFSIAFGVILSISRQAKPQMDKEIAQAEPLIEHIDEVRESLDDLDGLESLDDDIPMHENDIPDYGMDDHNNL